MTGAEMKQTTKADMTVVIAGLFLAIVMILTNPVSPHGGMPLAFHVGSQSSGMTGGAADGNQGGPASGWLGSLLGSWAWKWVAQLWQ